MLRVRQRHRLAGRLFIHSLLAFVARRAAAQQTAKKSKGGHMDQDARWARLEVTRIWADIIGKVLSGLALVVAAWWTYTNFTVERTHDPTMEVSVSPSVHPFGGDQVLLNVDVFMRNVGKVAVMPKFQHADSDQNLGLEISIVEMEPLGRNTAPAPLAAGTDSDPTIPWFDWTSGDGNPKPLLHKRNLLASNEDFCNGCYQLNPGVRYREPFACVVERDKLYAIRARFWTNEGSVADLVYIDTFRQRGEAAVGAGGAAAVPRVNPP